MSNRILTKISAVASGTALISLGSVGIGEAADFKFSFTKKECLKSPQGEVLHRLLLAETTDFVSEDLAFDQG